VQRHVSYWLVPAAAHRAFFQELIETLAHTYQAPIFVPHVTIYSGESPVDENPQEIIAQATLGVQEIRLQVDCILYTDTFTKTLFVQFHPSEPLSHMSESMRRLSARPSAYRLDPHLSLLYKHMAAQDKQRLAATIQVPMSEVSFDAVWANTSAGGTHTAEDVERWQIVSRKNLQGTL
jgi:Cyclic phosphodiesterase-like protein